MIKEEKNIIVIGVGPEYHCKEYLEYLGTYTNINIEYIQPTKELPIKTIVDTDTLILGLLTGGADVNPTLYGEPLHPSTYVDDSRDKIERDFIKTCRIYNIPILGFCRGAQLLTVENGGKLIQDIDGHMSSHLIDVNGLNKPIVITSDHHQMMNPTTISDNNYDILAWAHCCYSSHYTDGLGNQVELPVNFIEPEIIYYKRKNHLAIQGHPEYSTCSEETKRTIGKLISKVLL